MQDQVELKDNELNRAELEIKRLRRELDKIEEVASDLEAAGGDDNDTLYDDDNLSLSESTLSMIKAKNDKVYIRCKFSSSGCKYKLPSMQRHEERDCKYRPARCPSLTCPLRPPFATILQHIKVSKSFFTIINGEVAKSMQWMNY